MIKPKKQNLFSKLAGGLVDRGRHNAPRRSPRGLTFEPLEGRQLMATTAISNLLNVPVQFKLQSNSHLVETTGKVSTDLGVVQGLYQGKDHTGTLVAYELVNNTLKEFVPKSPWVTVGTVGQSAQNANDNVFFTQGSTLFLATGVPGAKLPVLADVQSLSTAGTQAVVQVGPYLTANLTASLGGSSGTSLSFTNVQLNLGGFASSFLGKAIADLQAFTRPLQPLADDLETPFIAGSNFTTLWVMQQLGYGQAAGYARTFADTVHAINALTPPVAGTATSVNLGSFTAQVQSPTQLVTVGSTLASVAQVDSHLGSLAPVFAQLRSIPGLRLAIDDPQQLLSLVTGKASTLFTYTLSVPQAISVSVQQQLAAIPVSPVTLTEVDIYANLGVSASAQATFGFDTTGYQSGNLANGFFIQNASLNARLTAGLSGLLNEADLAGYQITGAVTGSVTASLHGASGSNKVYANQFMTGGLVFSAPNWNFGITTQFLGPQEMLSLAIHQFGPYLKNLVGTDAQIATDILKGNGVSVNDIAVALGTVYGIQPQTTTGILKGLNKTANEVAGAVHLAYATSAAQTAQLLSKAGFGLPNIAGALSGAYDLNPGQVANVLYNQMGGVTLRAVAAALYNGIGGMNPGQVAHSLYYQMGGVTRRTIADALYNGIGGMNPGQVAYSLYNQMGGVTLRTVADALYNGIGGMNPGQVAYSLYNQMGGVTLRAVADALYNGIGGMNPGQVAYSLYNQMGGVTLDSVADALYNGIGGLNYSQIAFSLFRQMGGVSVNDVASALYYGLGGITWADALEIVESI